MQLDAREQTTYSILMCINYFDVFFSRTAINLLIIISITSEFLWFVHNVLNGTQCTYK